MYSLRVNSEQAQGSFHEPSNFYSVHGELLVASVGSLHWHHNKVMINTVKYELLGSILILLLSLVTDQ